jgi:hypothetical protein
MKLFCVVVLSLSLIGCVTTYRDFPEDALAKKPASGTCSVMYYNIKRFDILDAGGYDKLQQLFRNAGLCKKMIPVDSSPVKGLYVEVEAKWKPMTLPAVIFGYLSVATLTLLPAWSTHDGYIVKYNVYIDGKSVETYPYEITRKTGLWLGLLPFAWINFFTFSEEDAFEATTYQFVKDARQYLALSGR